MKTALITDMTLRNAAAHKGLALSFREKTETAKLLDRLGADVIELPRISDEKADVLLIRTLWPFVKSAVLCCDAGDSEGSVKATAEALSGAAKPRLLIAVPTSAVQMEYTLHKKPEQALAFIGERVAFAAGLCCDVEFSAQDATRSEPAFLRASIKQAIAAGARTVTVCDTAGLLLPGEFAAFIKGLRDDVPELAGAKLMAECGNDLHMAAANAFSALTSGADGVKTVVGPNGHTSLTELSSIIRARGDDCGVASSIRVTELQRAVSQMSWFGAEARKDAPAAAPGPEPMERLLDESADISRVASASAALGYDLSSQELAEVYGSFRRVASKKKVGSRELEAIIASSSSVGQPVYMLSSYVINTGNLISSTAGITIEKQGVPLQGLCYGDGPLDAAIKAIEQILGHHYELDDFRMQSVTEGREAVGEAIIKLRSGGKLYSGRGVSTDIVGASIRAYLNALNKIVSENS